MQLCAISIISQQRCVAPHIFPHYLNQVLSPNMSSPQFAVTIPRVEPLTKEEINQLPVHHVPKTQAKSVFLRQMLLLPRNVKCSHHCLFRTAAQFFLQGIGKFTNPIQRPSHSKSENDLLLITQLPPLFLVFCTVLVFLPPKELLHFALI